MIGPHEGKELELMLKGEKHLALFYDIVREPFINNENIIPEEDFAPYIADGTFLRHSKDFIHSKANNIVRYVCFTTPDNEWRAKAFFHFHAEAIIKKRPFDDAYEFFVGRLLDYSENDIKNFLDNLAFHKTVRT